MKQIEINSYIRSISFDSDGIYTINSNSLSGHNYFEISDSEINVLVSNISKITIPKIVDGDILYFDKNTAFPKLLLGRLDLDVKRTVKSDKCTKFIVNEKCIIDSSSVGDLDYGYVIMVGGTNETDYSQIFYISDKSIENSLEDNITLDLMQRYFPGIWKRVMVTSEGITINSLNFINSFPEKITTVRNLALYLNSKLPSLDSESAKTMVSLFKSGAEEKKLAVNMVPSFNISSILFDICEAIGSSSGYFDNSTKSSINYKYFRLVLGLAPSDIESSWRYGTWYKRNLCSKLFHNPLISSDQKFKAWKEFCNSVDGWDSSSYERKQRTYSQYNMPLNYDPKRETSTSDSEVEGQ